MEIFVVVVERAWGVENVIPCSSEDIAYQRAEEAREELGIDPNSEVREDNVTIHKAILEE